MYNEPTNKQFLIKSYTCIDDYKNLVARVVNKEQMDKIKTIDVNLWSFDGAVSAYSVGYGMGGNENANGIVSPYGWEEFKTTAANAQKDVDGAQ